MRDPARTAPRGVTAGRGGVAWSATSDTPARSTGARRAPADPVCYVVPQYSTSDSSHMAHLPRFLAELARWCDVHVVIQHADATPVLPGARSVHVQRARNPLARAVELVRIAVGLRRAGCRTVFVRISVSAALVLGIVGRALGLRVYYWQSGQSHNLLPPWRSAPRRRLALEAQFALQRLAIRAAYRLVTGPERMVRHYVAHFGARPERTVVLYNDVDVGELARRGGSARASGRAALRGRLGLAPSRPVVLFVGRVSPLKGARHILPLAEALRRQAPEALLLVVGDHAHSPGIADRAAADGLTNVRFEGARANETLAAYFAAADVFVLPSDSEGFPRVLIEAMAYGTPAVAFDVGGVADIVPPDHARFVVARGDVVAMAARVAELLRDDALRAGYVAAARDRVARFSTEVVARMFRDRILGGGAPASDAEARP